MNPVVCEQWNSGGSVLISATHELNQVDPITGRPYRIFRETIHVPEDKVTPEEIQRGREKVLAQLVSKLGSWWDREVAR